MRSTIAAATADAEQMRALRARLRSQVLIARAQGLLEGRYGLTGQAAVELLQFVSQQHNVRVRLLAQALVTVPGPDRGAKVWFLRRARVRTSPPLLPFAADAPAPTQRTAVINMVLARALDVAAADVGNVQLADPVEGGLRIESHRGHPAPFLDFFDHVADSGSACAQAAQSGLRVTIGDVATSPVYDEASRAAMLTAGYHAVHSVPLNHAGQLAGMVSTHYPTAGASLTTSQEHALDSLGRQAGAWLTWHDHAILCDALEDLHHRANTSAPASASVVPAQQRRLPDPTA